MSKPGEPPPHVDPAEQVRTFLALYRDQVEPETLARLTARARDLDLKFSVDELCLLAALDTPERVQDFLNTQIYYNNDHASPDMEETVMAPRQVLQTGKAHCFEGAMFAYAVDYLHGHDPRLVLLESIQDSEHNLVLMRDPQTGLYGCNAHSAYPHLDGRPAVFSSVRDLAATYRLWYYSDRSKERFDLTLMGYSDPFDLVAKYGVAWMSQDAQLWDIYYTYIDDTLTFHDLVDDSGQPHLYPLIRALKEGWIGFDEQAHPVARPERLPADALALWHVFWKEHGPGEGRRPVGHARALEMQFRRLTGTTPIDLVENAGDFQWFLDAGYRVDQILTQHQGPAPSNLK
jgi:hypothetical protein